MFYSKAWPCPPPPATSPISLLGLLSIQTAGDRKERGGGNTQGSGLRVQAQGDSTRNTGDSAQGWSAEGADSGVHVVGGPDSLGPAQERMGLRRGQSFHGGGSSSLLFLLELLGLIFLDFKT